MVKCMHKFVFLYFLFFLLVFSYLNIRVDATEDLNVVFIDPGHGGLDGGCSYKDLVEKDINLKIALKLRDSLEEAGYEVLMSRSADIHLCKDKFSKKEDLLTRIEMINSSNADLFISIHTNSFTNPKYFGAQVFYNGINPNNLLIASNVQSYLSTFTKTTRVHKNLDNIMILRNINKAGCLIETGFISNPNEYELYQSEDYLIKLANCIMYGIDDYFKVL